MTRTFKPHPPPRSATANGSVSSMSQQPSNRPGGNYLKINMILNPAFTLPSDLPSTPPLSNDSPVEEREYTTTTATDPLEVSSSPASSTRGKKGNGNGPGDHEGSPPVQYPPHEYHQVMGQLSRSKQDELRNAYEEFRVVPRGRPGDELILKSAATSSITADKSGRYVGITRLSRADFEQTLPRKAYNLTPNLLSLCFNNTGGITGRQGYWLPFNCARELCLTFCYQIRWALVPIFGYSFVDECLPENHPRFWSFKIDPATVAQAVQNSKAYMKTEAQIKAGSKSQTKGDTRSGRNIDAGAEAIPDEDHSETHISTASRVIRAQSKKKGQLPKHKAKNFRGNLKEPQMERSSPVELISQVQSSVDEHLAESFNHTVSNPNNSPSPEVSPRTRPARLDTPTPTWTSINRPSLSQQRILERPVPLAQSLHNRPPRSHPHRFRPQVFAHAAPTASITIADNHVIKRPLGSGPVRDSDDDLDRVNGSRSRSESDDEDIVVPKRKKRRCIGPAEGIPDRSPVTDLPYSAADYRAAMNLLSMVEKLGESSSGASNVQ
nr:transcriptional repressor xbp1 [Quercus suber]